ncbi:MAG TPA: YbdD/YjiX family protein [Gemmatimonadales bacterium]|jgi:uncharacterized short protein YbdD (DUF466 family)|nr:YbdD/YjiX family protein [Gemmatimonadales bacterium]
MWASSGRALRPAISGLLSAVRRIAGMPDYAAHLEHLRRCHPDRTLPSEREFYEEYVRARYADGPTRCC